MATSQHMTTNKVHMAFAANLCVVDWNSKIPGIMMLKSPKGLVRSGF